MHVDHMSGIWAQDRVTTEMTCSAWSMQCVCILASLECGLIVLLDIGCKHFDPDLRQQCLDLECVAICPFHSFAVVVQKEYVTLFV
jgi:hypothetical protein